MINTQVIYRFESDQVECTRVFFKLTIVNTILRHCYSWLARQHLNVFVCFVALRPKSTAMFIAGRSVHLTTLFPGQA